MKINDFFYHKGFIYYFLQKQKHYKVRRLTCDLPSCEGYKLISADEIIGYKFKTPDKLTILAREYIIVSGRSTDWVPYTMLPGLRIFISSDGCMINSDIETAYIKRINK